MSAEPPHSDGSVSDDYLHSDNDVTMWGNLTSVMMQRAARLTVDATPEPAVAGRTLTVKGKLTRADRENLRYSGYQGQKVVLQFRADGAGAYKAVKTITSGAGGALSTTTKATKSGSCRFVFAGTATTGTAQAAADHVKVTRH
ncbi:hypothetical protein ABZ471_24950 [Streptomyces sp. NPDC005728]|uniref:hypothetical protein n=1 Tax=Streptomyces sp. NPDC005728 TaxID=3157054 RepID=UPI0033FD3BAA